MGWSWPKTNFEVKQLEALEKLKHMVKEFLVEVLEDIEKTFKFEQSMRDKILKSRRLRWWW